MNTEAKEYADTLSRMIRAETISATDQEDVSKFRKFHELLRELFPSVFKVCVYKDYNGSFLLRWPGKTTAKPSEQGLMLMNHHDVVSVGGAWEHAPFSGEVAEGKVWGRGTLDDKGPLWAMLQAAEELIADGFIPERDVYFESACTEETTGAGAKAIAEDLREKGFRFEMILDEGGMMLTEPIAGAKGTFAMIGVGEKGCADLKFIARSKGGHASSPPKDTPLVRLGKYMSFVDAKEIFSVKLSGVTCEMLKRIAPHMGGAAAKVMANPEIFAPVIKTVMGKSGGTAAALLKTTIAFIMAKGSSGNNVIPDEAYVIGNMRYSHHQGRKASIDAVRKVASRYGLEVEVLDPGIESSVSDWKSRPFALVEEAVASIFKGVVSSPYIMTGASDARFMGILSDHCLRFAPFHITDEQLSSIHGINENVDIDALAPAVEFYKYVIQHFQGSAS